MPSCLLVEQTIELAGKHDVASGERHREAARASQGGQMGRVRRQLGLHAVADVRHQSPGPRHSSCPEGNIHVEEVAMRL